ncbi:MAG: hypothetical protein HKN03_11765 [Acidimicrobiales bacterium]|nr:hypothetical protein [Acidimicrobiales bacterium]
MGDVTVNSLQGRTRSLCSWLIDADPAIRWQVSEGVFHAPREQIAKDRALVATEGWGAQLLSLQDADGTWAGALYSPKWTSTTYTLLLLHRLGLEGGNEQARRGTELLWNAARFYDGGINLAKTIRQPETCITGMLVLLASAFGSRDQRVDDTVAWLLEQQLADGGWNCDAIRRGATHGSVHTTITVLEALLEYQNAGGQIEVGLAMAAGREFLLIHRLYKSHRTGDVIDLAFTRFPFPPQWHYDIMRGLEHFRAAGADRDPRMLDAIEVIRNARRSDGKWPMYRSYSGRHWFRMEARGPSRWSTLRALRVLDWWEPPTAGNEEDQESHDANAYENAL